MDTKAKAKPKRKSVAGRLVNFRLSKAEQRIVRRKARRFTSGNMSAWIRYAALTHTPPKKGTVQCPVEI